MENQEIWKDIPGYEGHYQVSDLGRVKSIKFGKERILNPSIRCYYCLNLCKNNKVKNFDVHQLVAMAFLGHKPNGYEFVIDHINSDKLDNRLENLRIVSTRENRTKLSEKLNKTSKFIGVHLCKLTNKWISKIVVNGKQKYLGLFNSEEEAHKVYQDALKTLV